MICTSLPSLLGALLVHAGPAAVEAPPAPPADDEPVFLRRAQVVAITGGALAVAGAGLWVTGEIRLHSFPHDRALTSEESDAHRRAQHLATGGFATLMTGAAVLGVAWLAHRESLRAEHAGAERALSWTPAAGPGGAGLFVWGRF